MSVCRGSRAGKGCMHEESLSMGGGVMSAGIAGPSQKDGFKSLGFVLSRFSKDNFAWSAKPAAV